MLVNNKHQHVVNQQVKIPSSYYLTNATIMFSHQHCFDLQCCSVCTTTTHNNSFYGSFPLLQGSWSVGSFPFFHLNPCSFISTMPPATNNKSSAYNCSHGNSFLALYVSPFIAATIWTDILQPSP